VERKWNLDSGLKNFNIKNSYVETNDMDVKIPENLLYQMVELLVEPKSLKPAKDECVLHLSKRDQILNQLLVMRRKALLQRQDNVSFKAIFPLRNPNPPDEAA
jgi:hypothetical protein